MPQFLQVQEQRTWHSHTLTDVTPVNSGEDIVTITPIIENAPVSLVNFKMTFESAGKAFYIDKNGNEHYLTDPNQDWPAKRIILATTFLKKGESIKLRFSTSCDMYDLYVSHTAGVF